MPRVEYGDAVYFDETGPHRGPGVARGEGERAVLYLSWAGRNAYATGGVPVFAFPPKKAAASAKEGEPKPYQQPGGRGGREARGGGGRRTGTRGGSCSGRSAWSGRAGYGPSAKSRCPPKPGGT